MKFDKDTLIKNRFWVVLGTAVAFTLLGWMLLLIMVPSMVSKAKTAVEVSWTRNKTYDKFKHPDFVKDKEREANELKNELSKVHADLFNKQANEAKVMSWPPEMEQFNFQDGLFAVDITVHPDAKKGVDALKSLKDNAKQMSGILTETDSEWFKIKNAAGKTQQFLRTLKIKIADPKEPKMTFGDLSKCVDRPVTVTFIKGKYFGEDLTEAEVREYCKAYRAQLFEVLASLGPVNYLKRPVVLLRYPKDVKGETANETWIYKPDKLPPGDNRFFNYVYPWSLNVKEIKSDEIWTAQENVWVQREIFKQIKAVNDSLGECKLVERGKDGKSAVFENYYWRVELKMTQTGVEAKLKNLRPQRQPVDNLNFLLRFKDPNDKEGKPSEPVVFPPLPFAFEGDPVAAAGDDGDTFPGKGAKPASFALPGVSLTGFYSVEQLLTVDTAAVKRIDVVNISAAPNGEVAVSHRQGLKALTLLTFNKRGQTVVVAKDDPIEAQPGEEKSSESVKTEVLRADISGKFTKHGLLLNRYLEVNETARKLPINLVLIVGPEHVARVQAALISSPLRLLETQVFLQRTLLGAGGSAPGTSLSGRPGAFKAPADSSASEGSSENQENIELTIYGVFTLYDRPDRPADKKQ